MALLITDSCRLESLMEDFQSIGVWIFIFIVTAVGLLAGGIVKITVDFRTTKWWYYGLGYALVTIGMLTFLFFERRSARLESQRTEASISLPSKQIKELMEHGVTDSVNLSVFGELEPVLRQLEVELKDTAYDFKGSETEPTGEMLSNGTRQKIYTVYYTLSCEDNLLASVLIETDDGLRVLAHRTDVPESALQSATKDVLFQRQL